VLADAQSSLRRLISHMLQRAGAEVDVAENGRIAIERALAAAAEGTPYAVVLLDLQMPVMDGYEASRALRAAGYTGPIVALTAHVGADERRRCLAAGCDDMASKPVDWNLLLRTILRLQASAKG
jgi:CheY-like chemotaxis protein